MTVIVSAIVVVVVLAIAVKSVHTIGPADQSDDPEESLRQSAR